MPATPSFYSTGRVMLKTNILLNIFYDRYAAHLTQAEILVCMFIFRRTYCFNKVQERISTEEFINGVYTDDGQTVTGGIGLHRVSLHKILKKLEATKLIKVTRKGVRKYYSLNVTLPAKMFLRNLNLVNSKADNPSKSISYKTANLMLIVNNEKTPKKRGANK